MREKGEHKNPQQSSNKTLEDIINSQKPYYDKSGLGYNSIEADKWMDYKVDEDNHKSYEDIQKITHLPQHQKIINTRMQPEKGRTINPPEESDFRSN